MGGVVPVHRDVTAPVLNRAQRVEAVHLAAVDCGHGPRPAVPYVVRCRVGRRRLDDPVDSREGTEVVIEGVVLLHDHDDVLDGSNLGSRGRSRPEHDHACTQQDQGSNHPGQAAHGETPDRFRLTVVAGPAREDVGGHHGGEIVALEVLRADNRRQQRRVHLQHVAVLEQQDSPVVAGECGLGGPGQ